jgi:hypothetical protein
MSGIRGSAPGERRGGRQKGTPNKVNSDLKEMILGALSDVGGRDYLALRAVDTPAAFLTLIGKVLPMQITGEGGGPVFVITGVDRDDDSSNSNDPSDASETSIKD